jgi:hypothetical protein
VPPVPPKTGICVSASQLPTLHNDGDRPRPELGEGLLLGRYRVLKRLGSGAFATVYAARDERLERDVAVKLLIRERIESQRFETEARAAARLAHPAIVTLFEATVDDDGAYLVSELVRGRTLAQLLASGGLSDRDVLQIGAALADALEHAHASGVIHRDVKPSNVLVPARRGERAPHAKLTDFGVARVIGGASLTRHGDVVGTLEYMAPEQAEGREAGPPADLYALALVVYEALTGVNPLRGADRRRASAHVPPLRRQRRDLPHQLGVAVDRALRPRPTERGSVAELRAALVNAIPGASEGTGVVAPRRWAVRDPTAKTELDRRRVPRAFASQAGGTSRVTATQAGGTSSAAEPPAGSTSEKLPARLRWPERGLGAVGAALAAWWICRYMLGAAPLAPVTTALLAAAAVLLAPRLGAVTSVFALAALAVAEGHAGAGLMLVAVAAITLLLLLGAPSLWPVPAGAVALGVLGLGLAWPAVVGCSPLPAVRRAGLAAAGLVWVAAAGALMRAPILWRPHRLPGSWAGSLPIALHQVLIPAAHATAAAAIVWAAAAAALPLLVRLRRPEAAIVLIAIWSGVTASATGAALAAPLHGAVAGAVLGGALAAAVPFARLLRKTRSRAVFSSTVP